MRAFAGRKRAMCCFGHIDRGQFGPHLLGMFVFHPGYAAPLPEGHRFPMSKYEATRDALAAAGGSFADPQEAPRDLILGVHLPGYADAVIEARVYLWIVRRPASPAPPPDARRSRPLPRAS